MSQINTITIPAEEGTQLPISDSITSPDSGITASSKAAYDLSNKIDTNVVTLEGKIKNIEIKVTEDVYNSINAVKASISNVNNTADAVKNVASAAKLTSARTIGGVSFDGTANIDLPGVNAIGNQNTTGNSATTNKLKTPIFIGGVSFDGSDSILLPGVNIVGNQNTTGNAATATTTTGNAATATKLLTARTITLTGGVTGAGTFDGSNNLSIVTTNSNNIAAVTAGYASVSGSGYGVKDISLTKSGTTLILAVTKIGVSYSDGGSE